MSADVNAAVGPCVGDRGLSDSSTSPIANPPREIIELKGICEPETTQITTPVLEDELDEGGRGQEFRQSQENRTSTPIS
jgi:hypothetical protein